MSDDGDNRGSGNAWLYLAAATQFTTSPIAGGAVGYFADKHFGTAPKLALLGFLLGFIGGTINLVRILRVPSNSK
jgi:F0F1-type ATP synthase assembly protein I